MAFLKGRHCIWHLQFRKVSCRQCFPCKCNNCDFVGESCMHACMNCYAVEDASGANLPTHIRDKYSHVHECAKDNINLIHPDHFVHKHRLICTNFECL